MKQLIKEYHSFLKGRFRSDKAVFVIELIYVLFCIGSGVYFAVTGKWQNTFMSLVFPLIVLCACIVEWKCNVRGGAVFYVIFFSMCTSNILGNGYGFYGLFFPYFDKVMHTLSGIVFTCIGYMLMKRIVGGDGGKKFVYCLFAGIMFAMAIAALWEVYEYFVSEVLHDDMQANYVVNTIDYINYISNTTVYFTDGTNMQVEGYIDIGLFDTLQDITVCFAGSLVTVGLLVLDNFCFKRAVNRLIIPEVIEIDGNVILSESEKQIVSDIETA